MALGSSLASRVRSRTVRVGGGSSPTTSTRGQQEPTSGRERIYEGVLKRLIEQQDNRTEASRVQAGYVHVSSLIKDFCPRKYRLAAMDNVQMTEFPSSADRVMWIIGRAIEHHVRVSFTEAVGKAQIYGHWTCPCEATVNVGFHKAQTCNSCNQPLDLYRENVVCDHTLKITGSPDMLWQGDQGILVVEIKSMNKKEFDAMDRPKGNHVFQASCYHKMLRDQGVLDLAPNIAIFYGCKDYSFVGSPYREFHVAGNGQDQIVEGAFEQVRLLRNSEERGSIPDRLGVCASNRTPTAKNCPLVCNCFSR